MEYFKYLIICVLALGFYTMPLAAEMHEDHSTSEEQVTPEDETTHDEDATSEDSDDVEEQEVILDEEMQ